MGIAIISTYPPRKCGIAEYTHDLRTALIANGESYVPIIALEKKHNHACGPEVVCRIRQEHIEDYINAAKMINSDSRIDAVMLQHEFSLFGGTCGRNIIELLKVIDKPVYTTFHTVLEFPDQEVLQTVMTIAHHSRRVMTFSLKGISFLSTIYKINHGKLLHIPLGVKEYLERSRPELKKALNLSHGIVASTFGLLSPNKGIELVLHVMPDIVRDHPEFMYVIIGVTHPEIFQAFGEKYREQLMMLIYQLGLENNVLFVPRYLSNEKLRDYIEASDIYITPYHTKEQISSATLTLAASLGSAIISTPYYYAEELLAENCGVLFPFKDKTSLTKRMKELIEKPKLREALGNAAKNKTRRFSWSKVARSYIELVGGRE